jgi:hypothetical protein
MRERERERERGTSGQEREGLADARLVVRGEGLVDTREAWRERGHRPIAPEKGMSESHERWVWRGVGLVGGKSHGWMQWRSGPCRS